jgi:PAS domain S-box-containing protein
MGGAEKSNASVSRFPLVGAATSDLDGLVAVVRRLTCARSLAEIMEVTTQAARTLLRADGITFVLREGDFCYYAEEDALSPLWKGRRFPISLCISGWCMIEGKAAVIPDVYQDPRIPHDVYRPTFVHSLAMVPVRQEAPIAAMGAYWSAARSTSPADLELLQTIANAAALAVAFVQLQPDRHAAGAAAPAPESNRAPEAPEIWDPQNPRTISGKAFARGFDLAQAMVCDLDGIIRFWSGGMEALYGWSRDEAIGRRSHDLLETECSQPREQIEAELLRSGHWHGELKRRTRGGRQVVVASHWALQRDDAVKPAWIIEIDHEITAQKLAQSELQRAKTAAEQAVQSKSQALATIGHDLRQPLHVIRMVLSVLGPKLGASDQKTLVARADQSVDSLAEALDLLVDEARLEYGLVEPRVETFPIQETLDQIANQGPVLPGCRFAHMGAQRPKNARDHPPEPRRQCRQVYDAGQRDPLVPTAGQYAVDRDKRYRDRHPGR